LCSGQPLSLIRASVAVSTIPRFGEPQGTCKNLERHSSPLWFSHPVLCWVHCLNLHTLSPVSPPVFSCGIVLALQRYYCTPHVCSSLRLDTQAVELLTLPILLPAVTALVNPQAVLCLISMRCEPTAVLLPHIPFFFPFQQWAWLEIFCETTSKDGNPLCCVFPQPSSLVSVLQQDGDQICSL